MPVLIVHGDEDRYVPARLAESLYAAAPQPKKLLLIPNGTHNNSVCTGDADYRAGVAGGIRAARPGASPRREPCRTSFRRAGQRSRRQPRAGPRRSRLRAAEGEASGGLTVARTCPDLPRCSGPASFRANPNSPRLDESNKHSAIVVRGSMKKLALASHWLARSRSPAVPRWPNGAAAVVVVVGGGGGGGGVAVGGGGGHGGGGGGRGGGGHGGGSWQAAVGTAAAATGTAAVTGTAAGTAAGTRASASISAVRDIGAGVGRMPTAIRILRRIPRYSTYSYLPTTRPAGVMIQSAPESSNIRRTTGTTAPIRRATIRTSRTARRPGCRSCRRTFRIRRSHRRRGEAFSRRSS